MRVGASTIATACLLCACIRPGEHRPDYDLDVGIAALDNLSVEVDEGNAAVRAFGVDELVLWAGAPTLTIALTSHVARAYRVSIQNCMPGAEVLHDGSWKASVATAHPTRCDFDVDLLAGENQLFIAPPDFDTAEPFRFAAMGDIQTALGTVDDVFEMISAIPDIRFVICTGDIVEDAEDWEYELYQEQLEHLLVPIYSTIGNHEVRKPPERWHQLFGRFSVHFRFKNVDFSLVDSGNASIDPKTYKRLQEWLDEGSDRVHIFGTHFPPRDPIGGRNASFRSRNEGAKLMTRLAEGRVDLTLYGHIHSYYSYQNAGIPAYVSGGGGALPERYEGIGRHFLAIAVDPLEGLGDVEFVAVDAP